MKSVVEIGNQEKFKRIDQYQFLQLLGKGANGLVYKGLNTQDGSFVAIKEMIIGKSEMKTIKTELNFLKKLQHPAIVKYLDGIQKDNRIYLILEYIEGGSLGALVKKSKLDEEVIKLYIKQILVGLDFLHKEGVIHRDIKGANILITKHGKVKLADFGVAIRIEENQKTISAAGSPYWIAPQIITGEDEPSIKCDIWSVGCTIIQLLTGNPPYFQLMQFPALFRIVQDQHPPLPECSQECANFLLQCFIKNPKKRPNSLQLLNHPWLQSNSYKMKQEINSTALANLRKKESLLYEQIEQSLNPTINYEKLLALAEKIDRVSLIYNNPFFYNFIENKYAISVEDQLYKSSLMPIFYNPYKKQRILIIYKLIQNNPEGLQYLEAMGLFSSVLNSLIKFFQQNQSFHQKQLPLSSSQKKEESVIIKTAASLVKQIIRLYIKSIEQHEHYQNYHEYLQKSSYNLISVVIKFAIPAIGKLLEYLGHFVVKPEMLVEEQSIKYTLIAEIYQLFIFTKQESLSISTKELGHKINQFHLVQLMNTNLILEELLSLQQNKLNFSIQGTLQLLFLKLELCLKLLPILISFTKSKHKYRSLITHFIKKLIKQSFIPEYTNSLNSEQKSKVTMGRMLIIRQLVNYEIGRAFLQRNGLIYRLSQFYQDIAVVYKNSQQLNEFQKHLLLMVIEITNGFIFEEKEMERNRVLQINRYEITNILLELDYSIQNKQQRIIEEEQSEIQEISRKLQELCSYLRDYN